MDPLEKPKQPGVARRLESCADKASSALPILLKCLWSLEDQDIHTCTDELSRKVSVDLRIVEGLAVPLAAAKQVIKSCKLYFIIDRPTSSLNIFVRIFL